MMFIIVPGGKKIKMLYLYILKYNRNNLKL